MSLETPVALPNILESIQDLSPEELRKHTKEMTASQLDELVATIENESDMPKIFEDVSIRNALSQRLEEADVTEDTRKRWMSLQQSLQDIEKDPLEGKSFMQKLFSKGGINSIMKGIGLSVLAWFGFKNIGKLGKGAMNSAEFVKNHPIITALLSALGISTGTAAYKYMKQNEKAIVERVTEEAEKTGASTEEVAHTWGEKLHAIVGNSAEITLPALSKGVSTVFGGEYNEETGVVTFPGGSAFHHPVVTAYVSGIRADGGPKFMRAGFSTFLVQKRLDAILQQGNILALGSKEEAHAKRSLAKKASDLLKAGVNPREATPDANQLERILKTLSPDLDLKTGDILEEVRLRPEKIKEKIHVLEREMHILSKKELKEFGDTRSAVIGVMDEAETALRNNKVPADDVESFKRSKLKVVNDHLKGLHGLQGEKLAIAQQIPDLINELGGADGKGRAHLDNIRGSRVGDVIDNVRLKAENVGVKISGNRIGGFATKAVIGYSIIPLALEGFTALSPGEKGRAAKKAVTNDVTEMAGGFIPVVGEYMDFRAAITGEDLNGRQLGAWQRVMSGTMGTLGSASIVAGFFTGGLSIVGFRAFRGGIAAVKAAKFARKANKGIEVMSTSKALSMVKKAEDNAEVLKNMTKTTALQRKAQKVHSIARTGMHATQVVAYGHLGVQLSMGAMDLLSGATNVVGTVQSSAHRGIDAAEEFTQKMLRGGA